MMSVGLSAGSEINLEIGPAPGIEEAGGSAPRSEINLEIGPAARGKAFKTGKDTKIEGANSRFY